MLQRLPRRIDFIDIDQDFVSVSVRALIWARTWANAGRPLWALPISPAQRAPPLVASLAQGRVVENDSGKSFGDNGCSRFVLSPSEHSASRRLLLEWIDLKQPPKSGTIKKRHAHSWILRRDFWRFRFGRGLSCTASVQTEETGSNSTAYDTKVGHSCDCSITLKWLSIPRLEASAKLDPHMPRSKVICQSTLCDYPASSEECSNWPPI